MFDWRTLMVPTIGPFLWSCLTVSHVNVLLLAAAASIKKAAIIVILFDAEPRKCAATTDLLEVYYYNPVDKLSWRMNVLLLRLLPILSKGLLSQSIWWYAKLVLYELAAAVATDSVESLLFIGCCYWFCQKCSQKKKKKFLRYLNYQDHTTGTTFDQKIKNKRPKKGQHQHAVVNKW